MKKVKILIFTFILTLFLGGMKNIFILTKEAKQELDARKFWIQKFFNNQKYDFVIIGDSRSLRGIDPELMADLGKGYNFSYPGAGLTKEYLELALKKLKIGGKILVSFTPFAFTGFTAKNEKLYEYEQVSWLERQWIKRDHLNQFFTSQAPSIDRKTFEEKIFYSSGRVYLKPHDVDPISGVNTYIKNFTKEKYSFFRAQKFTSELLKKLPADNIYFFRIPIYDQVRRIEESLGKFNQQELVSFLNEKRIVWIASESRTDYRTYDGSHLDLVSTKKYSRFLERKIKENTFLHHVKHSEKNNKETERD